MTDEELIQLAKIHGVGQSALGASLENYYWFNKRWVYRRPDLFGIYGEISPIPECPDERILMDLREWANLGCPTEKCS